MAQVSQQLSAKIVIIGGGIAGITAASQLSQAGITDFLLVEARDRIGGRIHTQNYGNGAIDMGAQYIHGAVGNPVYDLALQLDNIVDSDSSSSSSGSTDHGSGDVSNDDDDTPDDWNITTNFFYRPDGTLIDAAIVKEVHDFMEEVLDDGNKFSRENVPNAAKDSVGTFLHRQFYRFLRSSDDSVEVRKIKESIFHWRLLAEKTENACKSIYDLSLYAWGEYYECVGRNQYELKRGFQPILDDILKPVSKDRILLSTAVKAIYWDTESCPPPPPPAPRTKSSLDLSPCFESYILSETVLSNISSAKQPVADALPSKVVLHTVDGRVITADHVIVTCSLGFLKKHAHALFKPLLPNDKLTAIYRMGFGTVDKIYLQFPEPFWDKDCQRISFAWMQDEAFVVKCVENTHYSEYLHHDWYRAIQGFNTVAGHPCLLEGWVAAEEAQIMEAVPDQVVLRVCHELLQCFMGDPSIPQPLSISRSCWYRDPYSLGSYSYTRNGSTGEDCDTLAKPLPGQHMPLVLFAGEATHRTYFSTVHGALLSGQREADRLITQLKTTAP